MFKEMNETKKNKLKYVFFLWFALLIGICSAAIGSRYLIADPASETYGVLQKLYFILFFFGNFYFLTLILTSILAYPLSLVKLYRTSKFISFVVGWLLLVFLLADSYVYELYRMHLNLAMLQMTFLGGGRIVSFSASMMAQIIGLIALLALISFICVYVSAKLKSLKGGLGFLALSLLSFVAVNVVHSYSFAKNDSDILAMNHKIPLSAPLRMNKKLVALGIVSEAEIKGNQLNLKTGGQMKYPLNPLKCKTEKKPNILFIYVDSLRADALDEKIMPNFWKFSRDNSVFTNFHANANNTRNGIFSLFTSLPGTYWHTSMINHTPSILVTALQQNDYEIGMFTGAPLNMPEFHTTIFSTVKNLRVRPRGDGAAESDRFALEDFEKWRNNLPKNKPFFSFIFFDSVHAYQFPQESKYEKFVPYWKSVNHMKLNNDYDPTEYRNRYNNSAYFVDELIGKLLSYVKKAGLLDNTIIIISSDHGEEFNDNKLNYWGHNGNFTDAQTKVPFVVHWPGKPKGEFSYLASSIDIIPAILPEVLGCTNDVSDYSVGQSFWEPERKRDWMYASNYSQSAFVEKNRIVLFNRLGALEFLDKTNRPTKDKSLPSYLGQALDELSKYMK